VISICISGILVTVKAHRSEKLRGLGAQRVIAAGRGERA